MSSFEDDDSNYNKIKDKDSKYDDLDTRVKFYTQLMFNTEKVSKWSFKSNLDKTHTVQRTTAWKGETTAGTHALNGNLAFNQLCTKIYICKRIVGVGPIVYQVHIQSNFYFLMYASVYK